MIDYHTDFTKHAAFNYNSHFTVAPTQVISSAMTSCYFKHHRILGYPQNTRFPTSAADLQQGMKWCMHDPEPLLNPKTITDTLVFKLAHAILVGTGDEDSRLRFVLHNYRTVQSSLHKHLLIHTYSCSTKEEVSFTGCCGEHKLASSLV